MSLFWKYFKDTLKWRWIQAAGPMAALVQGAAIVMDGVREDILWLRLQAFPDTCDDQFLAIHGEARGIYQRENETLARYRTRVIKAYAWQLLGGKNLGLPKILEHYGYPGTQIYNMKEEDPARWAEFKIKLPDTVGKVISETDFPAIFEAVEDQKPARSKLAAITFERGKKGGIAYAGYVRQSKSLTIFPYSALSMKAGHQNVAGALRIAKKIFVGPHIVNPVIKEPSQLYAGSAIRITKRIRIGAYHV